MNNKILGWLAAALLIGPLAAQAQVTLDYSNGDFSGTITLNTPLPQNGHDILVSPSEFSFGNLGYGAGYDSLCPSCGYTLGGMVEYGGATFQFSTVKGHVSAWDINIDFTGTPGTNTQTLLDATISNSGAWYTQETFGAACEPAPGQPSPCQPISESVKQAGTWTATVAPEIDPASAIAGLTLLVGSLGVLRGRRSTRA